MQKYIGTKIIEAEPMDLDTYNSTRHKVIPASGHGKEGYLVRYPDGYESWSPKSVFDEAYRKTDSMNFGLALEAVRKGKKVARRGRNGKDMFIFLTDSFDFHVKTELPDNELLVNSALAMRCADGSYQVGWLASQTDMLSDDWFIIE